MEVHLGKGCLEYLECGLCEVIFETIDLLQTHLNTCEVYECGRCSDRFETLSEVKRHAEEEHEDCQKVHHLKIDREDNSTVSIKSHLILEI